MARSGRKKRKQAKTELRSQPRPAVEVVHSLVTAGREHGHHQQYAEHHARAKDEQHTEPRDRKGALRLMTGVFSQLSLSVFFAICLGFFFLYYQQGRNSHALWWGFAAYLFVGLATAIYIQHAVWSRESEVKISQSSPSPDAAMTPSPEPPKTPHDYFRADFSDTIRVTRGFSMTVEGRPEYQFETQLILDFESGTKFLTIYLPPSGYTPLAYRFVSDVYKELLKVDYSGIGAMEARWPGERGTEFKDLQFSGRIIIYHEGALLSSDTDSLTKLYKARGLDVKFRGLEYVIGRNNAPLTASGK